MFLRYKNIFIIKNIPNLTFGFRACHPKPYLTLGRNLETNFVNSNDLKLKNNPKLPSL